MAVPFNMPEESNEVEVILNQLQYLLTKLQAALRRSRVSSSSQNPLSTHTSTARVRTNVSNQSRVREGSSSSTSSTTSSSSAESSAESSANLPDLLHNLAWLAAASQEVIETTSQQNTTSLIRPTRSRTSSESSCCEESKISESTAISHGNVQDWNQETENEQQSESGSDKSYSREGILSKIVPGPVSAPLWTAMICFVGWHIFRAR